MKHHRNNEYRYKIWTSLKSTRTIAPATDYFNNYGLIGWIKPIQAPGYLKCMNQTTSAAFSFVTWQWFGYVYCRSWEQEFITQSFKNGVGGGYSVYNKMKKSVQTIQINGNVVKYLHV